MLSTRRLACTAAFRWRGSEREETRAATCATAGWTGSPSGSLAEKMRTDTPNRSTAMTSLRINVAESRGQVLTTYPIVGLRGVCTAVTPAAELRSTAQAGFASTPGAAGQAPRIDST